MSKRLRILMFRSWEPLPYFATFSQLLKTGVGATESQLLLHVRALRQLGHEVRVLGVTKEDVFEEDTLFRGAADKNEIRAILAKEYANTEVVFTNVTDDAAELRSLMPKAAIVQVCQNGPRFEADRWIDVYGCVSDAQIAYYATKHKCYRHKFMLLPNVPPWHTYYESIEPAEKLNQIIWVGGFTKQGLRRYGKAVAPLLRSDPSLKWVFCGPSYTSLASGHMPSALTGLDLPQEQVTFKNLPLQELAGEICRSKVLLASLGGEDAGVAYLDGHALGVPVICGDDIFGKYANPEGMGLRCTTVKECREAIEFLLANPALAARMGQVGKQWIAESMNENRQARCLEHILCWLEIKRSANVPNKRSIQSDRKLSLRYRIERLEIKLANWWRKEKGI